MFSPLLLRLYGVTRGLNKLVKENGKSGSVLV